jgi:hypothetical protein
MSLFIYTGFRMRESIIEQLTEPFTVCALLLAVEGPTFITLD